MIEALIAGQRDPQVLADLARAGWKPSGPTWPRRWTAWFDDHHGELARMLLDQIDRLNAQIDASSTARIAELIAAIPAAWGVDADGDHRPGAGTGPDAAVLPAVARLDEIPGCEDLRPRHHRRVG